MASSVNSLLKPLNLCRFSLFLIISGCASVQQPTGGPRDTEAPKVVELKPENLTRNFKDEKIEIIFDEFVKLIDEYKQISISPSLAKLPELRAKKNLLTISFADSLERNTTYTINFGKGLADYNEGNILRNFSYVFSTGNIIDSLTISGTVKNSLTTKIEPELLVFLIPTTQDTIFGKKPANIITQTDSAGNFTFKNLKSDTYRLYALKEQSGDRIYNSVTEEIAFLTEPIALKTNVTQVKLETFKQNAAAFQVLDKRIEPDGRIAMTFNQAVESPSLNILNMPELNSKKETEFNSTGDSAYLWLPELAFDSIELEIKDKTKSLDTVVIRRSKRDTYARTINIADNIQNSGLSPLSGLILTLSSPASKIDVSRIILLDDSTTLKGLQVTTDSTNQRKYKLSYPWKSGRNYSIRINENTFIGTYGNNKYYTNKFKLLGDNLYGDLSLIVSLPDTANYLIQLIKSGTTIAKTTSLTHSGRIEYKSIAIGVYNIRVVYDANKNGKWDTGSVQKNRQPEKIWNSNTEISLRPNWDLEEPILVPPL
jgi:uncharacterized protein (DUF2141 family)